MRPPPLAAAGPLLLLAAPPHMFTRDFRGLFTEEELLAAFDEELHEEYYEPADDPDFPLRPWEDPHWE